MDDHELVLEAREGSKDAFAAIYDRYSDRLYGFVVTVLHDRDEAADVVHDTFLVAGSRLHQLRDPDKLRPWLFAIARHQAFRRIGQRARQEPVEDVEVTAQGPEPSEVASQSELSELVAAAAAGLNPRDQAVLDLHLRRGLDGQELGDAIGVSAGHAYVLLSRLRDQVERSLGALLVARLGRKDCEELAAILTGWDGRFSPLIRKRVARHVDDCETCADRRRKVVSPLTLLSAVPPHAAPAALRDRVLDDVQLVSYTGRSWPEGRGGFPPSMYARQHRRGVGVVAASVAAVVLLLAGFLVVQDDGSTPVNVEAAGGSAPSGTGPSTTVAASGPAASLPPGTPIEGGSTGGGGEVPGEPTGPSPGPPPGPPGPQVFPPGTTEPPPGPPPDTAVPPPSPPPDTTGPRVGTVKVTPATIWESSGGGCGTTSLPTRATVTVTASDPSGISAVRLNPGAISMRPVAGAYQAAVGPFGLDTAPPGGSTNVRIQVVAVDGAGNRSTASGSVTVNNCTI